DDPQAKLEVAATLCEQLKFQPHQSSRTYCQDLYRLAIAESQDSLRGAALHNLGIVEYVNGEMSAAVKYFQQAAQVRRKLPAEDKYIGSLQNAATLYRQLGTYDSAQIIYLEAIAWLDAQAEKDPELAVTIYNNLADLLILRQQHEEGGRYLREARAFFPDLIYPDPKGVNYGIQGMSFGSRHQNDSALHYYMKAKAIFEAANSINNLATLDNNIGTVYLYDQQFDSAYKYYAAALAFAKDINQRSQDYALYALNTAYPLAELGELEEARALMEEGYAIIAGSNNRSTRKLAYKNWARVENLAGNHQAAYDWSVKYRLLNDSMISEESVKELTALQEKYELEKRERLIAEKDRRNTQNLFVGGLVILAILTLATVAYLRIQQRRRLDALYKDLELKHEKDRISRDLHDNVGAQLTSVINKLHQLDDRQGPSSVINLADQTIGQLEGHIKETMGLLRDTIWAINKEEISLEQLADKLRQYLHRYLEGLSEPKWQVEVQGEVILSPKLALETFRILQEAIQNTLKHADAQLLGIHLMAEKGETTIHYWDDGKGFDQDMLLEGEHYGLQNMQDRAEDLGGYLLIDGQAGEGMSLVLQLPNGTGVPLSE
ncbi:MAG: tetratricopeptide repeat protein, partial [Bacteroidota bacterium]